MGADLPSDLVTVLKNHFPSLSPASSSREDGDLCRSLQRCQKIGAKGTSYILPRTQWMKIFLLEFSVWASGEASIPASVSQTIQERKPWPGSGQVSILCEGEVD